MIIEDLVTIREIVRRIKFIRNVGRVKSIIFRVQRLEQLRKHIIRNY